MRYKLYALYMLLGLTLVQYQNCAPGNDVLADPALGAEPVVDSSVDVIDQVEVGGISFAQAKVSTDTSEQLVVFGLCEQNGSLIAWKLKNLKGEIIERGLAECDLGAFEVALNDQLLNHCDENLDLSAALGSESVSHTVVEVNCD